MSVFQQSFRQMRANKTGPAGDQNLHNFSKFEVFILYGKHTLPLRNKICQPGFCQ
jgi:hypothetical protein